MRRLRDRFRKIARGAQGVVDQGPRRWAKEIGNALYEARYSIAATLLTEMVLALGRALLRKAVTVVRPIRKRQGNVIPFPRRMP